MLCASSRRFQKDKPWGFYGADPIAEAHHVGAPEDTQDGELAYARFDRTRATRYPPGLLPGEAGHHFG